MKSKLLVAVIFSIIATHSGQAAAVSNPSLITMESRNIFAPTGFDDNDNVQIVIEAGLPNTCYKSAPPVVRIDQVNHKIYVAAQAYFYSGVLCAELFTTYWRVIDLGILTRGTYDVIDVGGSVPMQSRATLPVATALSASPDDYLYAPIAQATIDKSSGKAILSLSGVFPSNCLFLQNVVVMRRVQNVIEVLPITGYLNNNCQSSPTPFQTQVVLPDVPPSTVLVHIRSMNGQSVNIVEDMIL